MKYSLVAGRVLFAFIFILSASGHFKPETIAYAASQGVPFASFSVPLSGVVELLGGLSILLGYKTRIGAWLIIAFLMPVTFSLHQFWKIQDPIQQQMDIASFMKNISMIGAALIIAYFGSGPLSLDARLNRKASH